MGRHKYDTHRRRGGFASARTPPTQPTEDPTPTLRAGQGPTATTGEGIFDAAKDLAKIVGIKAANKLARESGKKIGEKIVGRTLGDTKHLAQPEASETANVWERKEVAGDRIREILEANSFERKKTSPSKRQDKGRLRRHADRGDASLGPLAQDEGASKKVNEAISRLLADDD